MRWTYRHRRRHEAIPFVNLTSPCKGRNRDGASLNSGNLLTAEKPASSRTPQRRTAFSQGVSLTGRRGFFVLTSLHRDKKRWGRGKKKKVKQGETVLEVPNQLRILKIPERQE